ncbi:hypothetical protein HanRHA438_Chr16g0764281 [Helianthus annuus]|uniref:DUF4283 domain-containing protein n=1 Tax=Helianthus annuus TaxID=4232 RepID=A0A9K3GZ01_HELAN|nr:hypothetical protein HanXRQr2_Chr16g0752391 [Helianthus annuus]KAJ0438409.1 hypothetical protein HanHA300_Chr16g0613661 [Helianthus annuus]KAJ0443155.1 hypothetical protein HanIR_Chr16g0817601 [Helianthus annuus]KAJ0460735.1 hypothetical protein HanHA89_Chr16g0664261 [Helianthus annuus]KAJ0645064.1 hypothetical protein HanOQP8_Chr16g0619641 [Helianthus annuus]
MEEPRDPPPKFQFDSRKEYKEYEHHNKEAFVRNGCSFSAALTKNLDMLSNPEVQELGSDMVVDVHGKTSAFFDLQGRAVVGRVNDFDSLINLKVNLIEADVLGFKLHYLRGLNMMISFEDDIDASVFVLNVNMWKEWFVSLDIWSGQTLAYERLAWLKFQGVPLHLAENKVFDDIASLFGKVVKGSQLSTDDWDLSSSYVGVLVDNGSSISGSVTLCWRKKKFKVWVLEEQETWVPDCMLDEVRTKKIPGDVKEVRSNEEENESSIEDDEESVVRSDNEMDDVAGVHGHEQPDYSPPARDNEQSKDINVGGDPCSDNLGTSRGLAAVSIPEVGGDSARSGGDHRQSRSSSGLDPVRNFFNLGRPNMSPKKT